MDRLAIERTHLRNLLNDFVVQVWVSAEAIIKFLRAIEDFLKFSFKLFDGKRFVRAKLALCAFNAGATAYPDLLFRIARPHEQGVFVFPRRSDHGDRVRFMKAG